MMLPIMMSLVESSLSDTKLKWRGFYMSATRRKLHHKMGPCKHLMAISTDQNYDNLQMALTCRLISESYDAISSILG
jgi:hypothetical protein